MGEIFWIGVSFCRLCGGCYNISGDFFVLAMKCDKNIVKLPMKCDKIVVKLAMNCDKNIMLLPMNYNNYECLSVDISRL